MFGKEIYISRRNKLKSKFSSGLIFFLGNVDVSFNYKANIYKFRQDSNFLYYFGIDLPQFAAVIDIDKGSEILFGIEPDIDDVIWSGFLPTLQSIAESTGIKNVQSFSELNSYISQIVTSGAGIHYLPFYRGESFIVASKLFGKDIDDINKGASDSLVQAVIEQRSVKGEIEIADIEEMVEVAYHMHTTAMKLAKHGVTEREIAGTVEGICLSRASAVSFPVICSVRGEILHNPYYLNTLENGQLLLLDAGAESVNHYSSDITRVAPVGGKFTQKQKEIYEIVLQANMYAIDYARPGKPYRDVHLGVSEIIAQGLINLGLMQGSASNIVAVGAHALFFPHGLGHMMGLDVHDMEGLGENNVGYDAIYKRSNQFGLAYLRMAKELKPGYVLTDEPGIYFIPALIDLWKAEKKFTEYINYEQVEKYKDFGGIRIEDDLLITNEGCRVLGKHIPKTVNEVEDVFLT